MEAKLSKHKPRHITFDMDTLNWDAAKAYALAIGATGGVLILHPWRIKDEYKQMFEIMAERTGRNRYDLAKESAIGMDAFRWSPHCHGIVYGKFTDVEKGSDKFQYRMIRRMNSPHGTEGTLMYLFGHTFVPEKANGKCYRYLGFCSPQKLKPEWTGSRSEPLLCPHCQAEMVEEGTMDMIMVKHYDAYGWHKVVKIPGQIKIASPGQQKFKFPVAEPFFAWDVQTA